MKIKYNEKLYNNGLDLEIHIDFIRCKDNPDQMEVLQFSVSKGWECTDYVLTLEQKTLASLVREYAQRYE